MIKSTERGFTLIELMVLVVVIAIIAAIAIPSYEHYKVINAEKEVQAHMGQLAIQLERWRAKTLSYQGFTPYWNGNYGYQVPSDPTKVVGNSILYVPAGSDKTNYRYMLEMLDGASLPEYGADKFDGRCGFLTKNCPIPANRGQSWIIVAYPNSTLAKAGAPKIMMRNNGTRCKVGHRNSSSINVGSTDCNGTGVESW